MTHHAFRIGLAVSALVASLALVACPGDDTHGVTDDVTTPDTIFVPVDTVSPDGGVPDVVIVDTPADSADSAVDTTPAPVCPGGFGCPCAGAADCLDELCIESRDGNTCTRACITACPDGYDCVSTGGFGPDPVSACVPRHTRLCRPCHANSDCQNPFDPLPAYCVSAPDPAEGRFCASSCVNLPCPEGYDCADVTVDGGAVARQCVPADGATCDCRPAWAALGLSTTCAVVNAVGACPGSRSCGAQGLSACAGPEASVETCDGADNDCDGATDNLAPTACERPSAFGTCTGVYACDASGNSYCDALQPAPEACDGVDSNCDGETDEGSCDDGLACTVDVCVSATHACTATLTANSCLIDNVCRAENAINPVDPCQVCRPLLNPYGWSLASNTCTIAGVCYADGAARPGQPCDVCRATADPLGWTALGEGDKCDDGDPCTYDEICQATACVGALTPDRCQDQLACTVDSCNGDGSCTHSPVAGTCAIGGACYSAGVANPAAGCERCEPAADRFAWSAAPDVTPCDDKTVCTGADHCDGAGTCVGSPVPCDDGLACTADSCDPVQGCRSAPLDACVIASACVPAGTAASAAEPCRVCLPAVATDRWSTAADACHIEGACVASGTVNSVDDCQRCVPGTSQLAWSPVSVGSCGDPTQCLAGGHCVAGGCVGASDKCEDGLACTLGACNGDGTCTSTLVPGSCFIDGACYANGTLDPDDPCSRCDAASDPSAWSANPARCLIDGQCYAPGAAKANAPCLVCTPSAARTAWSPAATTAACNDSNACSTDDHCDGAGACIGDLSCDDDLACTTDLCTLGGCVNIVAPSACVIDGACRTAATTPGQPCLSCQPALSQSAWTPTATTTACNDQSACSTDDHCDGAGQCAGNTSCNDGFFCTSDACTAAGCTHAVDGGWCLIGGACRAEGAQSGQGCLVCNPAAAPRGWTPLAPNSPCNDASACSVGERCDGAGSCIGNTSCDDGILCTSDACDAASGCSHTVVGGWCLIGGQCYSDQTTIANGCAACRAATNARDWTPTASGVSCDDGNPCSADAACNGLGACVGEASCDDGDVCTVDECTASGCRHDQIAPGRCLIDGACVQAGPNPSNPCLACVPSTHQRAWTPTAASTLCNDASACSSDDHCDGAGHCVGNTGCGDGVACTDDVCTATGCTHPVSAGACLIDAACYGVGPDPTEPCRRCDPTKNTRAWTYATVTTACDDQSPCSSDDHCDGAGRCTGNTACSDGRACTVDRCTGSGCDSSQIADGWCLISGTCRSAGADPGNVCRTCNPAVQQAAWTPAATSTLCSDGSACSSDDHCDGAGACTGNTGCDDGLSCTVDTCTGAGCDHSQIALGKCLIGGQCYSAGAKPGNPCLVCNPAVDARDWTPASTATACSDSSLCSGDDHCNGQGLCVGDTSCDDAIACTTDVCTASGCTHPGVTSGWCRINGTCYTNGAVNPLNACQRCDASRASGAWTSEPTTKACDDNNGCSTASFCNGAGQCLGDTSCNDGVSCTDDACVTLLGTQVCVNPVSTGRCRIDGACFVTGATQAGNVCYKCDPSGSGGTTAWSYNNGAVCTDGYGVCTTSDRCTNGTCQGSFVVDAYEGGGNNTAAAAYYLGSRDDDMNWPATLTGNLWGPGDEDWYRYHVADTWTGDAEPRVRLSAIPSGHDYDLCVYLRCTNSSSAIPSVSCPAGKAASSWTIGGVNYPGCCSAAAGTALEDLFFSGSAYDCSGVDDDYDAYVRVFKFSGAGTCSDYTLEWGDD